MNDKDFMKAALEEAELASQEGNWGIGCVLVKDGKIIAKAHNAVHTEKNRLEHAEIRAINMAHEHNFTQDYAEGARNLTLYTTYEPCPMCFGAILLSNVVRVVAGADIDNSGPSEYIDHLPEFFRQNFYKLDYEEGFLADECEKVWASSEPAIRWAKKGVLSDEIMKKYFESLDLNDYKEM